MSMVMCIFGGKPCAFKCPSYRAEHEYPEEEENKSHCWIVDGFKLLVNNGLSVIEYVNILKARLG